MKYTRQAFVSVQDSKSSWQKIFRGTKIFAWDHFFPVGPKIFRGENLNVTIMNMNMNLLGTIHPREMNDNEPTSPSPSSHPIA